MPQIGEITPGLWLLSGFGGHGLNTTAMAGEMVAHAIVDGDRAWQMFSPFALVWAGGAFGRAAQQVSELVAPRARRDAGWSRARAARATRARSRRSCGRAPPASRSCRCRIRTCRRRSSPWPPPPVPVTVVAAGRRRRRAIASRNTGGPVGGCSAADPDAPAAPAVVKRPKRGPKRIRLRRQRSTAANRRTRERASRSRRPVIRRTDLDQRRCRQRSDAALVPRHA